MAAGRGSVADEADGAGRLASTAAAILPPGAAAGGRIGHDLGKVVPLLRDWVIEHHDLPGSRAEQVEKTHLLLHAMTSAATMAQAITLLARFRRLVWEDRGARVEHGGGTVALVLEQPSRPGIAGSLSELWSLSFLLTELEFLAGGRIERVSGRVRSDAGTRSPMAPLLFDHPLVYGAQELELRLPAPALARPVIARGDQVEAFLRQLLPRTLGAQAVSHEVAPVVAAIVRADRLHGSIPAATLGSVAAQLGYSVATLRRRLATEGAGFRALREQVYDDLAMLWLRDGELVEAIADRLGYSDAFAFRRAFRRRHGCSPAAFRRTIGAAG